MLQMQKLKSYWDYKESKNVCVDAWLETKCAILMSEMGLNSNVEELVQDQSMLSLLT
jgi:hypothetical protein